MSEHEEQTAYFNYIAGWSISHPALRCVFAVPNGGKRSAIQGMWLRDEGLKAGVPDIIVPILRGKHTGLAIEMKWKYRKQSDEQIEWQELLQEQGWRYEVCYSCYEALGVTWEYLGYDIQELGEYVRNKR